MKRDPITLRARLDKQTRYSITLQRLIEGIARGDISHVRPEDSPHMHAVASKVVAEIEHLNLVIDSKSETKAAYREEMMELAREVDRLNKQNETMRAALVVVRDYNCRCGIMGSCGCGEVMIRDADDVLDELAEEGGDDDG